MKKEVRTTSTEEVGEQSISHFPCRSWCAECVAGRAKDDAHTQRMEEKRERNAMRAKRAESGAGLLACPTQDRPLSAHHVHLRLSKRHHCWRYADNRGGGRFSARCQHCMYMLQHFTTLCAGGKIGAGDQRRPTMHYLPLMAPTPAVLAAGTPCIAFIVTALRAS